MYDVNNMYFNTSLNVTKRLVTAALNDNINQNNNYVVLFFPMKENDFNNQKNGGSNGKANNDPIIYYLANGIIRYPTEQNIYLTDSFLNGHITELITAKKVIEVSLLYLLEDTGS